MEGEGDLAFCVWRGLKSYSSVRMKRKWKNRKAGKMNHELQ